MKISLAGLEHERGATRSFDFRKAAPKLFTSGGEEVKATAPLEVSGTITNTGSCFHVRGRISAKLELGCARCLERFSLEIEVPLAENYVKSHAQKAEEDWRTFYGDEIVLDEAVEEELNLNLPLRGLCGDNCQGLCPICGVNRNLEKCNCREERIDPRLAVLSQLMEQAPGGGGKDGST